MSINAVYEDSQGNVHESRMDGVDLTTKISIADDFSASVNYAVGDFCYHLGTLYKCTTAHTAGAWNAAHFTATQVGDEIGELKNTLSSLPQIKTFNYVNDQASPSGIFVVLDVPIGAKVIGINGAPLGSVFMYYRDTHERLCVEVRDAVSLALDTTSGINVNIDYI